MRINKNILIGFCFIIASCSPKYWPEQYGIETDEEPRYVDYGGTIQQFCTGKYPGSLYITVVDSSSGKRISDVSIFVKSDSTENTVDNIGNYIYSVAPRDSIFLLREGIQRRKFIVIDGCVDSVVVPLAKRKWILWN